MASKVDKCWVMASLAFWDVCVTRCPPRYCNPKLGRVHTPHSLLNSRSHWWRHDACSALCSHYFRAQWKVCFNCLNSPPLSVVNKTQPSFQTLEMWMEGWRDSVRLCPLPPSPAIRCKGPPLMLDWMYCENIRNVIPCQGLGHKLNWIYSPRLADLIRILCFVFCFPPGSFSYTDH